jgi:hypothetical protein
VFRQPDAAQDGWARAHPPVSYTTFAVKGHSMYHVFAILKRARVTHTSAQPASTSHEPDRIVAPGSLERTAEGGLGQEPPLSSRVVILAVVELLLPASGLVLSLQLWNGSLWWLWVGIGILLSVLVGYAFRSDIQLYPLDLSRR